MKAYFRIISIFILAYGLNLRAEDMDKSNVLTANAHVTVQSTKEWLTGTRLWLAVTIQNTRPTQIKGPILESGPFEFHGYSYELRDPESGKRITGREYSMSPLKDLLIGPNGQPAGMAMPSAFNMKSREKLRLLFPIGWPVEANPTPGEYEVELIIHGVIGELGRGTFKITVRRPTEEETKVLESIDLKEGKWASAKGEVRLPDSLKKNTGLGLELLLSSLSSKHEAVAEISEDELSSDIPSIFSPELDVLRYEILRSKQLDKKAEQLRDRLLSRHPGIRFRLDDTDKSMGIMKRAIKRAVSKRKESSGK